MKDVVTVWRELVSIPTYEIGEPEKNPMFLEKRVYQGSSGVVYPHAVVEKISDQKKEKQYEGIFLENEYLKVMVLPELGGRIQMAYDKVRQRHFVYYNHVIKPALVGLTGPWISGGIEFNWPQHHRPSTFEPVDCSIEENRDGSKTVWVNEVERMFHTKGMAGFTLYPGKAFLEVKVKLYNRTPFPQTFLWWANPAVKVNDYFQSIFPPDVYAVFDHGRRDVSSFPIATGTYYKVDYSAGTDISRYKNIPVPTSYMAIKSKYNFIGGYEHDVKAGLLHVADHHISPGKKQWTWGNGDFGRAWDRNLTDEDGPYVELMTGVYTDNQPDFCWIQPYEEKSFEQYFMPYANVGLVKNATKEAVIGIDFSGNKAMVQLYVTSLFQRIKMAVLIQDMEIFSEQIVVSPERGYHKTIIHTEPFIAESTELIVTDMESGRVLVTYKSEQRGQERLPPPAKAPNLPEEVDSVEQLYLIGLHIEQYRHATYVAKDYYEEALRRDRHDMRSNNALGLWYLRRGKFALCETYFRKAIASATNRNPNPYDGECFYNLGVSLQIQQRYDEAFDAFYKAAWNDAWQHPGFLNLALIAARKKNFEQAFKFIERSISKNVNGHTARHAKAFILRKLDKQKEALVCIEESLNLDSFNLGCLFEKYLLLTDVCVREVTARDLFDRSRNWAHNFIEYALDYVHAGLYDEAKELLLLHIGKSSAVYPMIYYYLGWIAALQSEVKDASHYYQLAAVLPPFYCFPNKIEDITALEDAIGRQPSDWKAHYYLGNLWYDKRQYEDAIDCWEKSAGLNACFPTVFRNLSLAYYNKLHLSDKSLAFLQRAFALDETDARVLMELDQLYKELNTPHLQRLHLLEKHLSQTESRDDLYLERVTLYNQLGNHQKAKDLLAAYKFHPWEGGEGKVIGQYLIAHLELAKQALSNGEYETALRLLDEAENYPLNLGEGKLFGTPENDIFYLKGMAYDNLGNFNKAIYFYQEATKGISDPVQAIFYNDPQPDKIFYQSLSWIKLGETDKAKSILRNLIQFGSDHIDDKIALDYFAVSLPDLLVFDTDLNLRNRIHCLYMMALGNLGLNNAENEKTLVQFDEVLRLDVNHQGALAHRKMVDYSTAKQSGGIFSSIVI